jgi:hypothetical protein
MLRAAARVPWLGALALESRVRPIGGAGPALADHAAWVATNALAACGRWVRSDRALPDAIDRASTVCVDGGDLTSVLAAIAAIPGLPIGPSLSLANRAMLRVLGIPVVDAAELAPGVRAIVGDAAYATGPVVQIAVEPDATGYVVAPGPARLLTAA